jgi:hypothetical protein
VKITATVRSSFADPNPDPRDPHVLGLPDPDPLIRGMDPDPSAIQINKKTLIPTIL